MFEHLTPDLLKVKPIREHPLAGHCYVASEALYHMSHKALGYKPMRARDDDGIVHWWLKNPDTGEICDATAAQYFDFGLTPPYDKGKFGGFLTKLPCKRTQKFMKLIEQENI